MRILRNCWQKPWSRKRSREKQSENERERERELGEQEEREKQIERKRKREKQRNREIEKQRKKERNRGKLRDSLYKITHMSLTGANSSFNTLVDHNFQHQGFVGYFILYSSHSTNLISHIRYGPFNGWIDDSVHQVRLHLILFRIIFLSAIPWYNFDKKCYVLQHHESQHNLNPQIINF